MRNVTEKVLYTPCNLCYIFSGRLCNRSSHTYLENQKMDERTSLRRKVSYGKMNYSFIVPSMLTLLVIMGYYFFRPRLPIRLNRAFLAILVIDICTELLECISFRLNETWAEHSPALLWFFNILFFVFAFIRPYMFFVFTVSVLDAKTLLRSRLHILAPIAYVPCVLIALSAPLTGWLFRIENGFREGPLYWTLYACGGCYPIFAVIAVLRHWHEISKHEIISLLALQAILILGNLARFLLPTYVVMNTFCLMAITVIFISFLNPDLFLSERGYVYNKPAFSALLAECWRRHRPCRVLGFTIQNYNEHREIFGGKQMDSALVGINRWLAETHPQMTSFYLRGGHYALVGHGHPDLVWLRSTISRRFTEPWKTGVGELRLSVSFVEADMEVLNCPSDKLINTLMISLDELNQASEPDICRSLTDSIEEIDLKLDVRRCLEKALENDGLEVFLQPLIDSRTGKRVAAEALVRLRDENGKLIRPDLFISMAEQEGYIVRLGEQVLEKVCRFIRDNDMDALGVRWINVNLSPVQFMSRDVPEHFTGILEKYGVSENMIHLEITEQSMIDFSLLRDQITGLHENGFEFSLDDYGSGYSNLSRVRQYPFTNIKIDMDVVKSYCREKDVLLPALIQGFKKMNLSITAEGIETEDMAGAMTEICCDYLQGFLFSRPVPMAEFVAMPA